MTTQAKNEAMELLKQVNTKLDALSAAVAALAKVQPASSGARQASTGEPCFPNYGRSKGAPVRGASMQDLEFYAQNCRRSLADESKQRWWEKEQALLSAIEAEISRQSVGDGPPPHTDEDVPF